MSKPGMATRRAARPVRRPCVECLEGRVLPTGVNWLSAFGIGVSGQYSSIKSNAVATDSSGDTYLTGSFRGTASFNPNAPSATITTNGTQDTFVAKYGPTNSLIWVQTFAGTTTMSGGNPITAVSQGSAIAVDGSGNVFVAGSFSGTVDLTGLSGLTAISTPLATTEVDLVKLDPNGNLTWVDTVTATATDDDEAYGLALDGSGGVVMAGSFADSATFGTTVLTAGGASDAFVSRVNGSGRFLWSVASLGEGRSVAQINGVAVDTSGNVVLAGLFAGTVDFDPNASLTTLVSAGSDDAMIWKLNSAGIFAWARSYGSPDYDAATAVAVDIQGNAYVTGAFSDSVIFGSTTLTAGPDFDTFVIKITAAGSLVWADGMVGPGGWSKGQGIAIDPSGDVDLGGTFSGLIDFNPGTSADNLISGGSSDVFAAGLDPNGNFLYVLQAGQSNFNGSLGVSVTATGLVVSTGTYSASIGFGSTTLLTPGVASAFEATLQSPSIQPPSPSAPVLDASSDTGPSQTDGVTSVTSPLFDIITAIAGDTVELVRNGVEVGTRVGPGSILDSGPLVQGTYVYSDLQISPSGISSLPSSGTSVTILTVPPPAPASPTLFASDDSGTIGDGITNIRQPRISVVATAGTTVQILNALGTILGSTVVATAGMVEVPIGQSLVDGTYSIYARASDLAGNISAESPVFSLTILGTPPSPPSSPTLLPADDSGPSNGTLTNVRQPRLVGTAKVGTTVEIFTASGSMIASAMVASNGTYTARVSSPLGDGTYVLNAVAVDVAANSSSPSLTSSLTIDGTPPASPTGVTLLLADDSGIIGDGITNVRTPRLTGQAEIGSTVQIVDGLGNIYGSAITNGNGEFTAMIVSPLADGTYSFQARAIDLAGNVGLAGTAFSLTILATPPLPPSIPALFPSDDSGNLDVTNVRQPRITGLAAKNTTVQILGPSGTVYATVSSGSTGAYVVQVNNPLADGVYMIHAVATDVAGNVSPSSPSLTLTILTATPATPSAPTLLAADDSGIVGDNITNVRQPRLIATAPAGFTVRLISIFNVVLGTTTAASSGAVTIIPTVPLADGTYILHLVAVDAAGNVSLTSGNLGLVILAARPATLNAPALLPADVAVSSSGSLTTFSRPIVVGTGVPGDRVDWVGPTGSVIATTTAASGTGAYQFQPAQALINGTYPVEVRQTDVVGNVSLLSRAFNMTIRVDADDIFGNGRTALGIFGNSNETFYIQNPVNGTLLAKQFGLPGDVPISGDFFGNGHDDIAVYRPSTSTFFIYDPQTLVFETVQFGKVGDLPVPADYDGDGKTDIAVFRPSDNTFYIQMSSTNTTYTKAFAIPGDIPVPADYFGDGHADIAVYRPSTSTFFVFDIATGAVQIQAVGNPNSIPIPADYEGIGRADFAVFEPSLDNFVIKLSTSTIPYIKTFAIAGDIPVPGDYFYDGRADLAVFRPSTATFYACEVTGTNYRAYQWGPAGQVKPVLAPITTWFNFSGGSYAIKPSGLLSGSDLSNSDTPLLVTTSLQGSTSAVISTPPAKKLIRVNQAAMTSRLTF